MKRFALLLAIVCGFVAAAVLAAPSLALQPKQWRNACTWDAWQCTEVYDSIGPNGAYTGHDEPSLLFYSNTPDSGNSMVYKFVVPRDPAALPSQNGTGAIWSFELHPAFWFGLAMCDNQSAPEYTTSCTPDSDTNIKDGGDPSKPDYIGYHAGSAYMEMQFYPPGWSAWPLGVSCSPTQWCAALNIDSLLQNMNTGAYNNDACRASAGDEPVAFAFITKSGVPQEPVDPRTVFTPPFNQTTPNLSKDLLMNPGDVIVLNMHDSDRGFVVMVHDLTTHQIGSMTAGASNGWSHVLYQPSSNTCNTEPYSFHPMYSTTSEHTRVPWAAHSYNVAFSDEIGHFELCSSVDESTGLCNTPDESINDQSFDDYGCFGPTDSLLAQIGGCLGQDTPDFDGIPYLASSWPGNGNDANTSTPITFTSPLIDGKRNYDRVAFETDLPRIEAPELGGTCNRASGAGCTNPPPGAFYPIYSTGTGSRQLNGCVWQLGGPSYPGTTEAFGGTSTAEYGPLLSSTYPGPGLTPTNHYNNFRRILDRNPCPASG
jgi:hypothetical protein